MSESLAVKYRPQTLDEVIGQDLTVKILKRQIDADRLKHAYLFAGKTGGGKTSLARAFAKAVNNGVGEPIEIDGASNNGVDSVRAIMDSANERSLTGRYKVFIIDECVSGDTEVLTEAGWKRFDSLDKTEKIAQYTDSGKIEFVKPIEFIEKIYNGLMYKVKIGNKAEFIMSPNHVQPLYYKKSGKIKESYIKDIKFAQGNYFVRSGEGVGELEHLSALDRVVIALQADGCLQHSSDHNYWTIQLKKQTKIDRLLKLLPDSGLDYSELNSSRPGIRRFKINTPLNITKKLDTYFNLNTMSHGYAREFIEELMIWDGYKRDKYYYYSSIDKTNVDFCQCVGILGGFKSRLGSQQDDRKATYKTSYRLYLESGKISTPNEYVTKESFDFDGKIYCVKVPSHKILIRRNGFELMTGNCHAITSQGWQAFLKGIEEPPEFTIFIFCTTEANKVPAAILNRVQRFNIQPIPSQLIYGRLEYICRQEGFADYQDTIDMISKSANGCMRDAITNLERCAALGKQLDIKTSREILGEIPYEAVFNLTWALRDKDEAKMLRTVDDLSDNGTDIRQLISFYVGFILDLEKYNIFKDINLTSIPAYLATENNNVVQYTVNFENSRLFFNRLCDIMLEVKLNSRYTDKPKDMLELYLLRFMRNSEVK